jgi:hypothetical protein
MNSATAISASVDTSNNIGCRGSRFGLTEADRSVIYETYISVYQRFWQ